jgi:hypothetical protein
MPRRQFIRRDGVKTRLTPKTSIDCANLSLYSAIFAVSALERSKAFQKPLDASFWANTWMDSRVLIMDSVIQTRFHIILGRNAYSTSCSRFSVRSSGNSGFFRKFLMTPYTSSQESFASLLKSLLFCLATYIHRQSQHDRRTARTANLRNSINFYGYPGGVDQRRTGRKF